MRVVIQIITINIQRRSNLFRFLGTCSLNNVAQKVLAVAHGSLCFFFFLLRNAADRPSPVGWGGAQGGQ